MAAQIELPEGQALSGLQWYHNDGTVEFPELILMEGTAGSPPDLAETALVLEQLQAASLAWGSATLPLPVTSSTSIVYAVFRIPDNQELTATGAGGGPGIGIRLGSAVAPSYLSADGQEWIKLGNGYEMAVNPTLVLAKGIAPTLASLKAEGDKDEAPPETIVYRTDLLAPAPNPFNPRTRIEFTLAKSTRVELLVYNIRGQRVRTLLHEDLELGPHAVVWQGRDERGSAVASGVYFVRMTTPDKSFIRRVALLR